MSGEGLVKEKPRGCHHRKQEKTGRWQWDTETCGHGEVAETTEWCYSEQIPCEDRSSPTARWEGEIISNSESEPAKECGSC